MCIRNPPIFVLERNVVVVTRTPGMYGSLGEICFEYRRRLYKFIGLTAILAGLDIGYTHAFRSRAYVRILYHICIGHDFLNNPNFAAIFSFPFNRLFHVYIKQLAIMHSVKCTGCTKKAGIHVTTIFEKMAYSLFKYRSTQHRRMITLVSEL